MATTVNTRDAALALISPRLLAPVNAAVKLEVSTPVFHVNNANVADPVSITVVARLTGIEGVVTFSCTGGTLSGISGNTATLTYANMSAATATISASITYRGQTFNALPLAITKVIDGVNGAPSYTWIKYATDAAGAGLSDSPTGMTYIGLAQNKSTATESTVATDYTWSLIQGPQGNQGVVGPKGTDGITTYTWIKYSDTADGTGLYDVPTANTLYIGIAVNKTVATESTVNTDYMWSKFKGDQGVQGNTGGTGARGAGQFFATGSVWDAAVADAATPGVNITGDVVTISNNTTFIDVRKWDGAGWVATAPIYNGGAIFPGTVTTNQLNTNGLTVRDLSGNVLLGVGVPLDPSLAAAGTKNSEQTLAGIGFSGDPNATFTSPSKGSSINDDPSVENPRAWALYAGITIGSGTTVSGAVGSKFFDVGTYIPDQIAISARSHVIDPSKTYSLTANLYAAPGNNRNMYVFVDFFDGSGAYLATNPQWGGNHSGYTFAGTPPVGLFTRQGAQFGAGTSRAIPAAAKTAKIGVWFQHSGSGDSSVEQAAQDIRLDDVTALNDKLSKTSASNLAATVTLTTGGSVLSGTTTNGTYQSPSGFYGVQGGVVKFSVPISGDPTFAGQLTAAYGTFGAVSIAAGGSVSSGQTAYNTGNGFWLGGDARFSMKTANGSYFLCDPANNVLSFNNASISNPSFDAFSVSIPGGTLTSSGANGGRSYGNRTVVPSGGKAPYAIYWSLGNEHFTGTGPGGQLFLNIVADNEVNISGNGTDVTLTATVTAMVTDANGFTKVTKFDVSVSHGTA